MVTAVPRPPPPPEHATSDFKQRAAADARSVPRYEREGMVLVFSDNGVSPGCSSRPSPPSERVSSDFEQRAAVAMRAAPRYEQEGMALVSPTAARPRACPAVSGVS